MIYIENGEFILNYNGINYKCSTGQFVLLRPGIPHSFSGIERELSQPHIHFDIVYRKESPKIPISFKDISEFTEEECRLIHKDIFDGYPPVPFVSFENPQKLLELFFDIINNPRASSLTQKSLLIQIIDMLITDNFPRLFSSKAEKYGIARQLKDYIDAGQGMSATLNDFEKQFSYSKYYLERQNCATDFDRLSRRSFCHTLFTSSFTHKNICHFSHFPLDFLFVGCNIHINSPLNLHNILSLHLQAFQICPDIRVQ